MDGVSWGKAREAVPLVGRALIAVRALEFVEGEIASHSRSAERAKTLHHETRGAERLAKVGSISLSHGRLALLKNYVCHQPNRRALQLRLTQNSIQLLPHGWESWLSTERARADPQASILLHSISR